MSVFIVGPCAHKATLIEPPTRILHLVQTHQGYDEIASVALDFARLYGADISFLCVLRKSNGFGHVTSRLTKMFSAPGYRRVHADIRVIYGDPAEEALHVASQLKADLIVLGLFPSGSPGRRGSIAYRIVSEAKSPVLAVRVSVIAGTPETKAPCGYRETCVDEGIRA